MRYVRRTPDLCTLTLQSSILRVGQIRTQFVMRHHAAGRVARQQTQQRTPKSTANTMPDARARVHGTVGKIRLRASLHAERSPSFAPWAQTGWRRAVCHAASDACWPSSLQAAPAWSSRSARAARRRRSRG
eukprot:1577543-Prymnesium_polylepis.1